MTHAEESPAAQLWRQSDLASHLRDSCRLSAGDKVMAHSSMKALGSVEGGPATLIAALQEVLTPEGLLAMPALSHVPEDGRFDVRIAPSRVGLITETFRTTPGVMRSLHPTHSVCAWGKGAAELLADHNMTTPTGANSPFHKFGQTDGRILMIGCIMTTCTLIHTAESLAKVPYLGHVAYRGYEREAYILIDTGGNEKPYKASDLPCCSHNFVAVQEIMEARGEIGHCTVGQASSLCFSARVALDTGVALLEKDPGALLCDNPECSVCVPSREYLPKS